MAGLLFQVLQRRHWLCRMVAVTGAFGMLLLISTTRLHAQTWSLRWSDEFNAPAGTAPDSSKWTFETGADGWGNAELEMYCAPYSSISPCDPKNSNLYQDGDGNLVIKAMNSNGKWTSGRMNTSGKETFQYGRIEARMKLPVGNGFWPAFWMLGNNIGSAGWPGSGEQDIMEWVQRYGPGTTSSTIHGPGYSGGNGIGKEFTFPNGGRIDDSGFHVYGVLWTRDKMQFYRDNPSQPFFTLTPANIPGGTQWVYNQPFFLLLNFAIGSGGFAGPTDGSTPKLGSVLVDYVRVYQPSSSIDPNAWYSIVNQNSYACVDEGSQSARNGGAVQQRACGSGQRNQEWQFTPTKSGYYKITSRNAALVWSSAADSRATSGGEKLQLRAYDGNSRQQWKPVSMDNGTYKFVARHGGYCLEVSDASAANGVPLQQHSCNGTAAQSFILTQQP